MSQDRTRIKLRITCTIIPARTQSHECHIRGRTQSHECHIRGRTQSQECHIQGRTQVLHIPMFVIDGDLILHYDELDLVTIRAFPLRFRFFGMTVEGQHVPVIGREHKRILWNVYCIAFQTSLVRLHIYICVSSHILSWGPVGLSRECVLRIPMRVVKGD